MKAKLPEITRWTFPREVTFEDVHPYVEKFLETKNTRVLFDLTGTEVIHSSFIGFMIHARSHMKKNGGELLIQLSDTVEKLFTMLNLLPYFSETEPASDKKSA